MSAVALAAWGAFAFGAVYPWAYAPLAIGSAAVGLLGLVSGTRPAWAPNRVLLGALAAVLVVAAIQLVPLPLDILTRLSPGTLTFLESYDFRFAQTPLRDLSPDIRH